MRGQLGSCAEHSCWPEPHVPVWTCLWRSRPRVGWSVRASEPWAGLGGVPALPGARSVGMSVLLELSPPWRTPGPVLQRGMPGDDADQHDLRHPARLRVDAADADHLAGKRRTLLFPLHLSRTIWDQKMSLRVWK